MAIIEKTVTFYDARCDKCGKKLSGTTGIQGVFLTSKKKLREMMEDEGWIRQRGKDYCGACSWDMDGQPINPKDGTPRKA